MALQFTRKLSQGAVIGKLGVVLGVSALMAMTGACVAPPPPPPPPQPMVQAPPPPMPMPRPVRPGALIRAGGELG